jgi:exodeoxyribonuclease V alpha subunit
METFVMARIREAVSAEEMASRHLFWQRPDDSLIQNLLASFQVQEEITLTNEQRHAVWLALTQRFSLLLGGAGTGKTSTLKAIRYAQEQTGGNVHAVALAGRAAQRIREATGGQARTLAGFLGALQQQELELGGADLLVVDEASMVDLPLAYSLLRRLPPDCRVLLVGDPYQLPPIGMGVVFSALAVDGEVPKVELSQVHRQASETGIPAIAAGMRRGQVLDMPTFNGLGKGVSFLPCRLSEAQSLTIEILGELGGPGECQILCPVKSGPAGIHSINAALHLLRATGKAAWCGFAEEDPVIHLENDYENLVWNGTLGVVKEVLPGEIRVLWDGHDQCINYHGTDLQNLDLAYAISVHKAQGSQFRRVVIPIFPSRLLDRTLVYTAMTRATEQVIMVGDQGALEAAVAALPAPLRRSTGMGVG